MSTSPPTGQISVLAKRWRDRRELTVLEPVVVPTGPLANVSFQVNAVQFIGPQAGWFEPFQVQDARTCSYLNPANTTPATFPVNALYNDHCAVNSSQLITYNGVTFNGNIVGCAQTTWP